MKRFLTRTPSLRAVLIPVLAVAFSACGDDDPVTQAIVDDIVDIVVATADVSTLEVAVVEAGLVSALQAPGPLTVFAPVNSAFDALGTDLVTALLDPDNAELLTQILTYHVVSGVAARSSGLTDGQMVTTLQGQDVEVGVSPGTVTVNGATVTAADVEATNGIIHLIDAVLVPEVDIVDVGVLNEFYTLVDLVRTAGLETALRGDNGGAGFTVFAPTDAAFAALPSVPTGQDLVDVLTYHVVGATVGSGSLSDGQVVTTLDGSRTFTVNINGAAVSLTDGSGATVNVVATDVSATNGLVHVIDGVLLPN
ncbi:MAG: fasciclin domain-containing protein [Gemmatimonadota bacterium]|nr:fasciclin domain-containing protein [Gemmatimonadota bacterium]MDH3421721.1 fasciclin domain-containing protein [Gemmatimonadota bacterium]